MSKIHKKTGNYCLICDEDASDGITFHKTKRQTHKLCIDCCDSYIITELQKVNSNLRKNIKGDNTYNIKCPGSIHSEIRNLCKCKIDIRRMILPDNSKCSLDLFRIKYVFSNPLAFICREEKCGEVVILDYDYQMLDIKCPSCSTTWCSQCNVIPFHYNMSCIEYETENRNTLNGKYIWGMREKGELQFCPEKNCKAPTIKNNGCFSGDIKILMWDTSIKEAKDIVIGDKLIGDDGNERIVKELYRGIDKMYEIKQTTGMKYIVNSEHKLSLKIKNHKIIYKCIDKIKVKWFDHFILKYKIKNFLLSKIIDAKNYRDSIIFGDVIDIKVNDYLKMSNTMKKNLVGYRSICGAKWKKKNVKIDPYFLGTWLGDGYYNKCNLKYKLKTNNLLNLLKEYNLINNKHIPRDYLINNRKTRLSLLAGIIDKDGYVKDNGKLISIKVNKILKNQIIYLSNSLGFVTTSIIDKNNKYTININGINLSNIPTKIKSKKCVNSESRLNLINTDISVSYVGKSNYYGWSVNKNKRFVLEDYTVVHNCNKMICECCHTKWCWLCQSINIDYEHYNEKNNTRCSNKLWE
jgi:hypothetical protein